MAILGQITVDELSILSVDVDPAAASTPAPVGSIALLDNNTSANIWLKTGAANNAWTLIPRLLNATALSSGGILYADASGNIVNNPARAFFDQTGRFSFGLNAPATPQSTIHLDRGTAVGSHVRFTAGTTTGQTAGDGTEIGIDDTGAAEIRQYENSNINFLTNNTRFMQLTPAGQLVIGANATAQDISGLATVPAFQIIGTSAFSTQMAAITYSNDANPSVFNLIKSRGAINTHVIVSAGDEIGRLQFRASDGVNFQAAASVRAAVDTLGTVGAGSMPGRLSLQTTPTGTTAPVERLFIDSTGLAGFTNIVRLGNGTDTTNGNMRFDGTEFQVRAAGVWRVLSGTGVSLTSTANKNTTSGTFALVTGMTTSPSATGTYRVDFSADCTGSGQVALYVNGVQSAITLRGQSGDGGLGAGSTRGTLQFRSTATITGGQAIEVRSNALSGTFTVGTCEFSVVPISR